MSYHVLCLKHQRRGTKMIDILQKFSEIGKSFHLPLLLLTFFFASEELENQDYAQEEAPGDNFPQIKKF